MNSKSRCPDNTSFHHNFPHWQLLYDVYIAKYTHTYFQACPPMICNWKYPYEQWRNSRIIQVSHLAYNQGVYGKDLFYS